MELTLQRMMALRSDEQIQPPRVTRGGSESQSAPANITFGPKKKKIYLCSVHLIEIHLPEKENL